VVTIEGWCKAGGSPSATIVFAHGAAQCGICTMGMLMAATDLLTLKALPANPKCAMHWGRVVPLHRLPKIYRRGARCRAVN
jgi:aerobic-type carbon monoxide dehydrogenase small subunit (CoxS/CutS family)